MESSCDCLVAQRCVLSHEEVTFEGVDFEDLHDFPVPIRRSTGVGLVEHILALLV